METKRCVTCTQELSVSLFYKRKDNASYSSECKICKATRSRKYFRENVEKHRRLVKRRYDVFGRFAKYGLSLEDYDSMLAEQGGKCALCEKDKPGGKGKWHIDHVGGTDRGKYNQCQADSVRGLLCHNCNVSLGHYEKLIQRVGKEKIVHYLKE